MSGFKPGKVAAAVVTGVLVLGGPAAAAGSRWLHYGAPNEGGPRLSIRARCMDAEDSMGHLRLIEFNGQNSAGPDKVVLGCRHRGY